MFRLQYNSPVILTFSVACVAAYFLNSVFMQSLTPLLSLSPNFDFSSVVSYLTLVSYIFGHASIQHLTGNLTFILLLGPVLEEKYGSGKIILMMLVTALATGILNILFKDTGIMGASGVVFMFIILISFTNVHAGKIPLTFILIMLLFVTPEILNSFKPDQISHFGHILGGITGSLFGFGLQQTNTSKSTV